eukprot:6183684-Pleurochrysis_carterae.AAC.2
MHTARRADRFQELDAHTFLFICMAGTAARMPTAGRASMGALSAAAATQKIVATMAFRGDWPRQ